MNVPFKNGGCGVSDPNRDHASSVWRVGPQVLRQKICQKE